MRRIRIYASNEKKTMPPIDPFALESLHAPFWFVQLFKIIGFLLHVVAMGLWAAGLPIALLALAFGRCEYSQRFAKRILAQMPIVLALGVNFAIVPLLFIQTAYFKPFYNATILTAWHWIAIIPLFLVAYYAVYACAFAAKKTNNKSQTLIFGWIGAIALLLIGLLIANGITLMENPSNWLKIWEKTNIAGATTGLGNNMRDPFVILHFLTMLSIGMITTAVYALVDSHFFIRGHSEEDEAYRLWTLKFSSCVQGVGAFSFVIIYLCSLLMPFNDSAAAYTHIWGYFPILLFFVFAAPCAIFVTVISGLRRKELPFTWQLLILVRYTIFLSCFAIIRQLIQNGKIQPYLDVYSLPESIQWSPIIAFLISFAIGAAIIVWMLRKISYKIT